MLLDALADRDDQAMTARQVFVLTCIYWLYVTATDVVYAEAMRIYVADFTKEWVFYPWPHRILQHILAFPLLVLCYRTAMHLGWRPGWGRAAVQFLMALGFSLSMYWMARLSAFIFHVITGMPLGYSGILTRGDWATWVSSAVTTLLAYSFGLALLSGIATVRKAQGLLLRNSELRRDWAGARLAALRSQLSPHALFNVLHTIQARIGSEPEAAQTLVASLGDLLRGLLRAGERDYSLLQDELDFVRLYLELQAGRFADRLEVQMPVSHDIPAVWLPSLILQPLVENAVVHGLADHSGPVRVRVTYELTADRLELRVENSTGSIADTQSRGIGLLNVRERLAVQFAELASLDSKRVDYSTWVATLRLPILREGRQP
jgi:sensor histidine kinase YesM